MTITPVQLSGNEIYEILKKTIQRPNRHAHSPMVVQPAGVGMGASSARALPNWMGNISATSRTSCGRSCSPWVRAGVGYGRRHCPVSALPLLERRRSTSDHWLTVMALRGRPRGQTPGSHGLGSQNSYHFDSLLRLTDKR